VLAMSPRFLLLPSIISYLFLGVTLWLLLRPTKPDAEAEAKGSLFTPRHLWLLPLLFALWVNLDAWFFLGPLCVGLYLLGEVTQDALGPELPLEERTTQHRRRVLTAGLLAGIAAGLLSPHHVWAFTLPTELSASPGVTAAQSDDRLMWLFLSPFDQRYFRRQLGESAAGLAFFPLVLAGAV